MTLWSQGLDGRGDSIAISQLTTFYETHADKVQLNPQADKAELNPHADKAELNQHA